jgi:hypothetical protein
MSQRVSNSISHFASQPQTMAIYIHQKTINLSGGYIDRVLSSASLTLGATPRLQTVLSSASPTAGVYY